MAKKKTTFTVYADLKVSAGLTIAATDLEDAVVQARQLSVTDFITFQDEFSDGEPVKIIGVYEAP